SRPRRQVVSLFICRGLIPTEGNKVCRTESEGYMNSPRFPARPEDRDDFVSAEDAALVPRRVRPAAGVILVERWTCPTERTRVRPGKHRRKSVWSSLAKNPRPTVSPPGGCGGSV